MKILLVSDHSVAAINGVVTSVKNLMAALKKRGHEVKLLTINKELHSDKIDGDTYALASFSFGKFYPDARVSLAMNSHLVKELIEWEPEIIHTNSEFSAFEISKRIAWDLDIPLVHTYHTVYEDYTHYFHTDAEFVKMLIRKWSHLVSARTNGVIAPSEKIRELLLSYGVKVPIYVVPTGINLDKFDNPPSQEWIENKKAELGISPDKKVVLFLGRVAKEKNIDELIAMAKSLPEDIILLIVGGGPDYERLVALKEKMGIPDSKVIFTGMVAPDEVPYYYRLGDVFCSSSTSETQGLTYYEAMACGLPLVCREDECLDGILENGVNGYRSTSLVEIAEGVIKILENEDMLKSMSAKSLEIIKKYSTDVFGENVEKIYLETIEAYKQKASKSPKVNITEFGNEIKNLTDKFRNVFDKYILETEGNADAFYDEFLDSDFGDFYDEVLDSDTGAIAPEDEQKED